MVGRCVYSAGLEWIRRGRYNSADPPDGIRYTDAAGLPSSSTSSMHKVVAFIGAKGGTLKTASVAAVAHMLADADLRLVMIDLDPQGDLTSRSGFTRVAEPLTAEPVAVAFEHERTLPLWLLRGGRSMEGADYASVAAHIQRALALDPDLVVIDTPPALGPATWAAAHAAHYIVVPSEPGIESRDRVADVISIAEADGRTPIIQIMLTKVNRQTNLFKWMVDEVDKLYPGRRSRVVIPHETAAAESAIFKMPTTLTAPKGHAAMGYVDLAADIIGRLGVERRPDRAGAA